MDRPTYSPDLAASDIYVLFLDPYKKKMDEKQFAPDSDLKRDSPSGCRNKMPISCTPNTYFLAKVEQKSNRLSGLH